MTTLIYPHQKTIDGKQVVFADADKAASLGYLSPDEYRTSKEFEASKNRYGKYIPLAIYVNGVFKGCTRKDENVYSCLERLQIIPKQVNTTI